MQLWEQWDDNVERSLQKFRDRIGENPRKNIEALDLEIDWFYKFTSLFRIPRDTRTF